MMKALILALASFVLSWIGTGLVLRYALRNAVLDVPNDRSSHVRPTARGGGLAIAVVFLVALLILAARGAIDGGTALVLAAGGSAIAVVGYFDDHKPVPARVRILVHVGAAVLVVAVLGGLGEATLMRQGPWGYWLAALIGVLALAWSTNLFNFMDGIDGIAGSEAAFVSITGAWLTWHYSGNGGVALAMLALAFSTLGFLPWNWPPARIFMGDVGSGFLGFLMSALGIAASRHGAMPVPVWFILGGVFMVDATLTVGRRMARGERWFDAHRTHAYQHLAVRYGHLAVTMLSIAINLLWLLPWAWWAASHPQHSLACAFAALTPLSILALLAGSGRQPRTQPT
ncbi:MAG TPA: glycosyltransferase family 4 protein [Steroidobacteraceae bacterium]|jgi:Fuc2NAc and GlcNAc transferase